MGIFEAIVWTADPSIVKLGVIDLRWYGLLFVSGFIIGQKLLLKFFKHQGLDNKEIDRLTIYFVLATVIGARLGHVLFYGPYFTPDGNGYFDNPISILYIWEGGLASHGAAIAILFTAWLYARRSIKWPSKRSFLWVVDKIVIIAALSSFFIRTGNLMNSEILGKPTNKSWGIVFIKNTETYFRNYHVVGEDQKILDLKINKLDTPVVDSLGEQHLQPIDFVFTINPSIKDKKEAEKLISSELNTYASIQKNNEHYYKHLAIEKGVTYDVTKEEGLFIVTAHVLGVPRHPAQMYEGLSYLLLFGCFLFMMIKKKNLPEGVYFGIFLIYAFTLRFFFEFLKENQSTLVLDKDQPLLNMGQMLSIPLVLFGIGVLYYAFQKRKKETVE